MEKHHFNLQRRKCLQTTSRGGAVRGLTLCSSRTGALVRVDQIDAGASILTGLGLALVDLFGAVYAVVPRDALTGKKEIHHVCDL